MIRETYQPMFIESDDYSFCKYNYLFQDLPIEFQNALKEDRQVNTKDLKKLLRRLFPGTKFYIRKDSYSGGSSVNIYYVDGPAKEKVEKAMSWNTRGFNGMYDISYSKTYKVLMPDMSIRKLEFDWYGYVFVHREYSKKAIEKFLYQIKSEFDVSDVKIHDGTFYVGSKEMGKIAYLQCNDWRKQNELLQMLSKIDLEV